MNQNTIACKIQQHWTF